MSTNANRLVNLRNLQRANWDVAFAMAFTSLVTGSFLIGYIKHLNGSDVWIGVLTGLPSFMGIAQVPGAIWGRSKPFYKKFREMHS